MKKKTSVSIDSKILAVVKREAKRQDRSVSYILEKFIEEKAKVIAEQAGEPYGPKKKNDPSVPSRATRPLDGAKSPRGGAN